MGVDPFDVITMGRVGIDFYPLQSGVGLEKATTFGKFLGGSATNVAVAAARHGHRTAVITRTGADPFGKFVHLQLEELGVDDRYVASVADLPTPVAFCEIFPPDDFPLYFYRLPRAPDEQIRPDELDLDAIADSRVFWVTASGLAEEPSRSSHHAALEARSGARHTVLDLDLRKRFWDSRSAAVAAIDTVIPLTTVVIGNIKECEFALGETDPLAAAKLLLERGVELAIVKMGPMGVLALTEAEIVEMPPIAVDVVNGLGAGDSFGGAICHGLLEGWPLDRLVGFANAAGALVASRLECSTAMPTTEEVERLLDGG
jgi:5-dehydro-2-deoxygluconokinase